MSLPDGAVLSPPASSLRRWLSPQPGPAPATAADRLRGLAGATLAVAAAMLAGHLVAGTPPLPNVALIFVPAIVYAALKFGFVSALVASGLSVLAYNFQFMEPFGAFGIRGIDDVVAVAVFLAVGAITSDLANQIRRQALAAREREAHTAALYDLKRAIERADSPETVARAVVSQIHRRCGLPAAIWEQQPGSGGWLLLAFAGDIARHPPATAPSAETLAVSMTVGGAVVGTLMVGTPGRAPTPAMAALLRDVAAEAGDALHHLRLQQELESARRLAETERLRGALLSSITHDFRTPLASILGATTALMEPGGAFTQATRETLLATIRDQALRLDRFIGNLLDMSRLEAGTVVPNLDWVDAVDIVAAAVQHVRRVHRDIAIDVAMPESLPMLRLDPVLVEHALVNILDNAAKHSPPHGRVHIGARVDGGRMVIEIDDQGPGVPAAERERIFDKFVRAPAGDRGPAGTGLGLSIARGFLEAQGGRVAVADRPGHGARFVIELPLPREAARASGAVS